MQLLAHATTFEFAVGIVIFLAGMCVGPWLAYVMPTQRDKGVRDQ
jgi:hypothetical protein